MKPLLSVLATALMVSLSACAYFDDDGMSKSPEVTSLAEIQGCYYFEKVKQLDYSNIYGEYLTNVYCWEICIQDSIATFHNRFYEDAIDVNGILTIRPHRYDSDTTYRKKVALLPGADVDGTFLYNLKIGKNDFIFESGKYGRSLRDYDNFVYSGNHEVSVCRD